jgi:hypothetical protein
MLKNEDMALREAMNVLTLGGVLSPSSGTPGEGWGGGLVVAINAPVMPEMIFR